MPPKIVIDNYEIGDILCEKGVEWIVDINLETNNKFLTKLNEDKDIIDEFIVHETKQNEIVSEKIKHTTQTLKKCLVKYAKKKQLKLELEDNLKPEVYETKISKFKYKIKSKLSKN
jgi:hypothetical protein